MSTIHQAGRAWIKLLPGDVLTFVWPRAQPEHPLAHLAIVPSSMNTVDAFVYTTGTSVDLFIDGVIAGAPRQAVSFGVALFSSVQCVARSHHTGSSCLRRLDLTASCSGLVRTVFPAG